MKKYSPNLLKKSIGTQTERSHLGTQRGLCETIIYPQEHSTSGIMIRNEIDMYNKPLCKTNSSPQIYLKLTPQKKSFHSYYFDYIRGVQSDRGCKSSMLTAGDDFHEVTEEKSAILVDDGSNETKEQKNCILSAVGHSSHEVVIHENCTFPIIDDKIIHVDQNNLISANSEGNNKSSQQEKCMSLAFDDKLKREGQNNLMSANNEVNSKSSKQNNCILPAVDHSNREVVVQKNLISPVIGYKLTRIENNNLICANTGCNNKSSEQEYCMSLFIDEIPGFLKKNDSISGNSEGNNKFNEQDNHMSLVIDDKIKSVDRNNSISENNGRGKSCEQDSCIEDYVPIWKSNTTPRQYRKTRNAGLSKIVNTDGLSADNEVCLSSVINDKPKPVDQNNSIPTINEEQNKSSKLDSCIDNCELICNKNTTPRQYNKSRDAYFSKRGYAVSNKDNYKSRGWMNLIEYCEPMWKKNTAPRQYKSPRGTDLIKIGTSHGNITKCFEKDSESNNFLTKKDTEANTLKNVVSTPPSNYDLTDTTAVQSIPAHDIEPRTIKITDGFSLSNHLIKAKDALSTPDHSNLNMRLNPEKSLTSVSRNRNIFGKVKMMPDKGDKSVITINYDLTDTRAVQSIPAHDIEPRTIKITDGFSLSNHSIKAKDALSTPDHSNLIIRLNPEKSLTSVSRNRNIFGKVKMMPDKGDKSVITIDLRICMPNRSGKKYETGQEFNEIITKPKVDFNVIKPNYNVKPKRVIIRPNADGKYVCSNCGKIYHLKRSFVQHMRRKCQKSYPCVWCNTEFKTKGELNFHDKRGCNPRPVSRKAKGAKERVDKLCEYCGGEFSNNASFYRHLQEHLNRKRYLCTTCGKRFTLRSKLLSHEKCVHTKEKPWYNCTRCPHRSLMRKHVMAHEKIHDLPEGAEVPTPFKCHCGKGFISGHMLTVHKNTYHKPKKCNLCGDILGNSKFLSIHKLSAHNVSSLGKLNSAGTSTQTCPICAESFVGQYCKKKLDKHLDVVHDIIIGPGVRLSCDICSYTFKLFASYILHKSTLHKVEVTESELRSVIQRLSVEGETRSAESSQPTRETRSTESSQSMRETRSAESSQLMIETRSAESSR